MKSSTPYCKPNLIYGRSKLLTHDSGRILVLERQIGLLPSSDFAEYIRAGLTFGRMEAISGFLVCMFNASKRVVP